MYASVSQQTFLFFSPLGKLADRAIYFACVNFFLFLSFFNKKHLKNVGPIRHNEPPHANSPDVPSGTVARRLRIDVYDNNANDNDNA